MKKTLLLALCGLLYLNADAQTAKKKKPANAKAQTTQTALPNARKEVKMAEWPQLRAFHEVMSQTFHPAEEGNFEPIRKRSGEMAMRMKDLIGNPFPEAYRTADMKVLIANLEKQVAEVHYQTEQSAPDKDLMRSLSNAHDAFHQIVGLCRKTSEVH